MTTLAGGAAALGIELGEDQLESFERYLRLILENNRRARLTSILEPDLIRTRHFLDSLTIAAAIGPDILAGSRTLDVGSGGGLPGVAMAIALPGSRITLLEASDRKARFLERVRADLALADLSVVRARAEMAGHLPDLRESFDVVVARAVAPLPTLLELTMPFCRVGGTLVAYKGRGAGDEVNESAGAIEATGGGEPRILAIDPAICGEGRDARLIVVPKTAPTPAHLPRRDGVPGRRPL